MQPSISPLVPTRWMVRQGLAVPVVRVWLATEPSANWTMTAWWSTTSLSHFHTQRPCGLSVDSDLILSSMVGSPRYSRQCQAYAPHRFISR